MQRLRWRRAGEDPDPNAETGSLLFHGDKVTQVDLMQPVETKPLELSP